MTAPKTPLYIAHFSLHGLIRGERMELGRDLLDAHRRARLAGARHPALRAFIEAAFAEVTTCHDLRGMAVMLGRAIERRKSSAPPAPPAPARHVIGQRT